MAALVELDTEADEVFNILESPMKVGSREGGETERDRAGDNDSSLRLRIRNFFWASYSSSQSTHTIFSSALGASCIFSKTGDDASV